MSEGKLYPRNFGFYDRSRPGGTIGCSGRAASQHPPRKTSCTRHLLVIAPGLLVKYSLALQRPRTCSANLMASGAKGKLVRSGLVLAGGQGNTVPGVVQSISHVLDRVGPEVCQASGMGRLKRTLKSLSCPA
jgi:hypothetical protein